MALRIARWARRALTIFLVAFIGLQFVRPDRTNPPAPPAASLKARTPAHITALLDRACRDCHSNETSWPWYTNISPASWLVFNHVSHGRDHFNYSEWNTYDSDDQDKFLGAMCDLVKRERMPLPSYLILHPDSKLSREDVASLCVWSDKMRDTLQ
jgi:Haem-binding domain